MFLWLCDVELMIIDSYLPKWELLVMDISSCNDYNIFFPRDTPHTIMTWQSLEPRPLSPESVAKTTLPYMKIHIFALRWKDEIRRSSQLRTLLKRVVVNRT